MKINKKALLYDIENMAYTIADTGEPGRHTLHRVRDICQDGNIDRVARVLGLAYSNVLSVLTPVLEQLRMDIDKDYSSEAHDYIFKFRQDNQMRFRLSKESKLKIKETVHEYMVSKVFEDWLGITLPEAADVWKYKAEVCFSVIQDLVSTLVNSSINAGFRRKLNPF